MNALNLSKQTTFGTCAALFAGTLFLLLPSAFASDPAEKELVYEMDFEEEELDSVPADFLVIEGMFAVKEEEGNRFFELPGTPLETYVTLFGPRAQKNIMVQSRAYGTRRGRRYPMFGVGLNGVVGYKLKVTPAKRKLELYRGDQKITDTDYSWESGQWTVMKLKVTQLESGDYQIQGKAWPETKEEPDWHIDSTDEKEPFPGQAAIWCSPYAGTPIRFDDLKFWSLGTNEKQD